MIVTEAKGCPYLWPRPLVQFHFCVEFNQDSWSTAHPADGPCQTCLTALHLGSSSTAHCLALEREPIFLWRANQGRKVQLLQLIQTERSQGQFVSKLLVKMPPTTSPLFVQVCAGEEIQDMLDGLCLLAVHA